MLHRLTILLLIVGCEEPAIEGCMTDTACNYNAAATKDDESCTYAEENYDCDENCIAEMDCKNVCGGTAKIDDCGTCTSGTTGLVINYLKQKIIFIPMQQKSNSKYLLRVKI